MEGAVGKKGTLAVTKRKINEKESEWVNLKQFCLTLKCTTIHQWSAHKIIIKNPYEKINAVLSSLTKTMIVNGKIYSNESEDFIQVSTKDGVLIPINLAMIIAGGLHLAHIEANEVDEEKNKQTPISEYRFVHTLIIDPGHGGADIGTSHGGITEKDLALIYALKLRDELKKEMPDLDVYLTRDNDQFISLSDRAKFANEKKAELFISLHLNHATDLKVEGIETFILSPDATDDEARKLALLENDSWLKSSNLEKRATSVVDQILVDMEQTKYIQQSALVASYLQQEYQKLEPKFGLKSRGVKQALFYVLSQVAMPSTLVEIGFLSHSGDRSRIVDLNFRDQFIRSMVNGLARYQKKGIETFRVNQLKRSN